MFLGLSGLAGFAFAGDDDGAHPHFVQRVADFLFPVPAIGGDGAGIAAGSLDHPLDRWGQLRGVGRVALLQVVIEHDAVVVVHDLRFVAELDRLAELAFGDRPGIGLILATRFTASGGPHVGPAPTASRAQAQELLT